MAMASEGGRTASSAATAPSTGVILHAYLKKLKTHRKKFFVLRAETAEASARLEYYDSERKFVCGQPPKRSIPLKNCFNINKKPDSRYKHVIALYTKDDCFSIALDSADDLERWLKALLKLQHGDEVVDGGEPPRPTFEHVWSVTVLNRGLGNYGLTGSYSLCLTDRTLSLIRSEREIPQHIELNLTNIRSCGSLKDFFFLEIGRQSTLGAGELWMQTEDSNIAQNVHSTVFHAMSNNRCKTLEKEKEKENDLVPKVRVRSSSATESSKPKAAKPNHFPGSSAPKSHPLFQGNPSGNGGGRERCDSMPSRARTTSEGTHSQMMQTFLNRMPGLINHRPNSLYTNREATIRSQTPPLDSPHSPSGACSTDESGSTYSLADEIEPVDPRVDPIAPGIGDRFGRLTPEEAIVEEELFPESPTYDGSTPQNNVPDYVPMTMPGTDDGYVDMSPKGRHNSPTISMSSITSGTPSTDMRFAEYQLEKVSTFFAPSESDCGSYDARQHRAYSVGSRPEMHRQKKYMEQLDNRARAWSCGSKTKKGPNRVLPPHHAPHVNGDKSISAPLLSSRLSQGSHNSIGPMGDLMEMDFSRSGSINSGYMDMRPGGNGPSSLTNGGHMSNFGSGYVEMKPGQQQQQQQQQQQKPEVSPYVEMGASPSSTRAIFGTSPRNDYVEMDGKKNANNNNNNNNYIDMSFNQQRRSGAGNVAMSPGKSSLNETAEGYVEMSLGQGHQRHSSWDGEEQKKRKGDKARSQPIAIKSPSEASRKYSGGTPPTMHLPLAGSSPYSSLPRQRSRKNSRRDSSSSSSVTTPSSSSTIFPISLNSPASPIKPEIKVPASVLHTVYKKTDDYTPMDFCGGGAIRKLRTTTASAANNDDDYVNYDPAPGKENRRSNYDHPWLDSSRIDETRFRPISEDSAESQGSRSRPNSATPELCSSSGSTIVGSRPESVNSRPGSVDVQLHYASLDLEDGNRSPRTVNPDTRSSPSVPAAMETTATLTYAAIDFVRSENLRHNSPQPLPNAKVKH